MQSEKLVKISLLFFLTATLVTLRAQPNAYTSARSAGLAGTGVAFRSAETMTGNPASLAGLKSAALSISASAPFGLSRATTGNIQFASGHPSGTFGLSIFSFGFDEFRQYHFTLAYARQLNTGLALGATFEPVVTAFEGDQSLFRLGYSVGMQYEAGDVLIGICVRDPFTFQKYGSSPTGSIALGIAWMVSEGVELLAELEKTSLFPLSSKIAIEYDADDRISVRLGFSTAPSQFHFGLGFDLGDALTLDIAALYHNSLGVTPAIGVTFAFNGNTTGSGDK